MAIATQGTASNYLQRAPSPSGLADVVDLILDKGLVIDAYVRVAVIGIELVTIDARIVIASVDTYLRFAEAVNRLDLSQTELAGLPELQEKGAEEMTKGAIEGVEDEVTPNSPALRKAMKGAAAAAAVGAAAAAARQIASKINEDGSGGGGRRGREFRADQQPQAQLRSVGRQARAGAANRQRRQRSERVPGAQGVGARAGEAPAQAPGEGRRPRRRARGADGGCRESARARLGPDR